MDPIAAGVNLAVFALILAGSGVFLWHLRLDSPGYRRLFVLYALFWLPLMLVRPYRAAMHADVGGDESLQWAPLAAYGLAGILARPLFDLGGGSLCSRKAMVYVALAVQAATFVPIIAAPSFAANVVQAVGVGVGASCIGAFSLWFNEQHAKTRPFLTVSVLSLPPLMADFLAAPIRSATLSFAPPLGNDPQVVDPNVARYLWAIALAAIAATFVLGFFVREDRGLAGLRPAQNKAIVSSRGQWLVLGAVIAVGASVDFVRFASADAVAVQTLHAMAGDAPTAAYEGYLSAVFSLFQLGGGLLMGYLTAKGFKKMPLYCLGAGFFALYAAVNAGLASGAPGQGYAAAYMAAQALSGFAYGVAYNLLIAHALSLGFRNRRFSPLGLYQTVAAAAIAGGGFFSGFAAGGVRGGFPNAVYALTGATLGLLALGFALYLAASMALEGWSFKDVWRRTGRLLPR